MKRKKKKDKLVQGHRRNKLCNMRYACCHFLELESSFRSAILLRFLISGRHAEEQLFSFFPPPPPFPPPLSRMRNSHLRRVELFLDMFRLHGDGLSTETRMECSLPPHINGIISYEMFSPCSQQAQHEIVFCGTSKTFISANKVLFFLIRDTGKSFELS